MIIVIEDHKLYYMISTKSTTVPVGHSSNIASICNVILLEQVLGLSLDEDEEGLVTDDKTISDQDKSSLIKMYTDLFMDYAKLILGVYRWVFGVYW